MEEIKKNTFYDIMKKNAKRKIQSNNFLHKNLQKSYTSQLTNSTPESSSTKGIKLTPKRSK